MRHTSAAVIDYITASRNLSGHVVSSAESGQLLPRLTIVLAFHCFLHLSIIMLDWRSLLPAISVSFIHTGPLNSCTSACVYNISVLLLAINAILNIVGYILIYMLYQHSVSTIFNRIPPKFPSAAFVSSFGAHISLLRPLEILFRFLTAKYRVLPDVIVLGEVRCGTTTLCQHLSELPGCHKPFCLWQHPELDGKESFYFVGHYLGYVAPSAYGMCFPLKITKWWKEHMLGKSFFTYDGCAQYLTSPTAPALIAETYRKAGQDPPILVACVRDPVDQAISWWRYENNAMEWGSSMGLSEWNTSLRTAMYPPQSIGKALEFSMSAAVQKLYAEAESLVTLRQNVSTASDTRSLDRTDLAVQLRYRLPSWAITWPGGQLSTIGRNGNYVANIQRYERTFRDIFPRRAPQEEDENNAKLLLRYVTVIPIEYMSSGVRIQDALVSIMNQVTERQYRCTKTDCDHPLVHKAKDAARVYNDSVQVLFKSNVKVRRNSGTKLVNAHMEPDLADHAMLAKFFSKNTADLVLATGLGVKELGWHDVDE